MKGQHGARAMQYVQAQNVTLDARRQLIAILDEYYGKEMTLQSRAALQKV